MGVFVFCRGCLLAAGDRLGDGLDSDQRPGKRAPRMACVARPAGVVCSTQPVDVYTRLDIRHSVGTPRVCWDNVMQQTFWSTLTSEYYDRRRWPPEETPRATASWIEEFDNRARLHSALGDTMPVENEELLTRKSSQPTQAP